MPRSVALEIITRHTSAEWARYPGAQAQHRGCDRTFKLMPYHTMTIVWGNGMVSIFKDQEAGLWCGTYAPVVIEIYSEQERNDFIDALISLGAKVVSG